MPDSINPSQRAITNVAAGLILRADGKLLLGQRPEGKPWSGWWEMPGGKLEPGETVMQALARELEEEIGIRVTQAWPWVTYVHVYPKTTVRLAFCQVTAWEGEPRGLENQRLKWVDPAQALADALAAQDAGQPDPARPDGRVLPGAIPPLTWLMLPTTYGISAIGAPENLPGFMQRLDAALAGGLRLVQLREPNWPDGPDSASLHTAMQTVLARCRAAGARLLINSVHPATWWAAADGVHLRDSDASALTARPGLPKSHLIGVSAHDAAGIARARELGADFAVLGHVLPTPSHPDAPALGWPGFESALADAGIPVFALGGQSEATRDEARRHGAHGIAGIRGVL